MQKKCKACGSFQTWRRHLGFWATVLSLILGIFSTWAIVEGPTRFAFKTPYAVSFERIGSQTDVYRVYLKNIGKKTISITKASALLDGKVYSLTWDRKRETLRPGEDLIIDFKRSPKDNRDNHVDALWTEDNIHCGVEISLSGHLQKARTKRPQSTKPLTIWISEVDIIRFDKPYCSIDYQRFIRREGNKNE